MRQVRTGIGGAQPAWPFPDFTRRRGDAVRKAVSVSVSAPPPVASLRLPAHGSGAEVEQLRALAALLRARLAHAQVAPAAKVVFRDALAQVLARLTRIKAG